jgi:GNAT superfamily N-acetyltransferase
MPPIDIVAATPADGADVIRLFGALHRYNTTLDASFALADGWETLVQQYLEQSEHSDDSTWLLARHDGHAIGFVLVEVHTDSPLYRHRRWAEIVGLYVEDSYRGSDVARLLMEHAYEWALGHRLRMMQLYVTAANQQAQRFYDKQGFGVSQIVMRRALTSADAQHHSPIEHPQHRLHFSESGARPLDMHGHTHSQPPDGNERQAQ